LLETPRALVILARGGTYAEDLPTPPSRFDHQKSYFEFWLPFIGVREVRTLVVEHVVGVARKKGSIVSSAKSKRQGVGRTLLNHQIAPGKRKQWSIERVQPISIRKNTP
jgi:FMN-dependent NADH-azoreductase